MNTYNFIECDGARIAAFVDSSSKEEEHPSYYPQHTLFYVLQGQLNLKLDNQIISIPRNKMGLVRKFTAGRYYKTWTDYEKGAKLYAFTFQDKLIQDILHKYKNLDHQPAKQKPVVVLKGNAILKGLFDSIIRYIDEGKNLDKDLLSLKTKEAFIGLLKATPEVISIFKEKQHSSKIDIAQFMEDNFKFNLPIKTFAMLTGRSLSTFQRDFKKHFKTTPHSWLMKKKLHAAKDEMISKNKKASDVYLEFGFKDLAHFSKAFKKEFKMPPTEFINQQN